MSNEEKEYLLVELRKTKYLNNTMYIKILFDSYMMYLKSFITFGSNEITESIMDNLDKMIDLINVEQNYLNSLIKNISKISYDEAINILNLIDDITTRTVEYYYDGLDFVDDAIDLREPRRALNYKRNFEYIDENKELGNRIHELSKKHS